MRHNKPKNILLITPFAPPQLGGAETHLEDLYEYLRNENYNVTLLTYQPTVGNIKGKSVEKKKNLIIYRFQWFGDNLFAKFESYPPLFNFLYITPYLALRSFWYLLFNRHSVDLIHVFGLNASFIARTLKLFFRKKIVMSTEALYDFKPGFFSTVCRWVLKDFDAILAGSDESHNDILKLDIPEKKIVVYTHWVRLDNFKPLNKEITKRELGWENKFTALYVGRLIEIKGVKVFIDVAKKFNNDIAFKIIGDSGPELDFVIQAAKKMPNLEFLGKVTNDKIGKYFAAADVYIYPALYNEDLARVLLESMASGTPVINTNPGSGVYKLTDKVAFVTKPNAAEIAQKVKYLYTDPEEAAQMSKDSIMFASQFGPKLGKIITNTYEKVYA